MFSHALRCECISTKLEYIVYPETSNQKSHLIGLQIGLVISSEMIFNICKCHSEWYRYLLIVVFFQLKIQMELTLAAMSSDDVDFFGTFIAALYFGNNFLNKG